jgi:hypothetical protein
VPIARVVYIEPDVFVEDYRATADLDETPAG